MKSVRKLVLKFLQENNDDAFRIDWIAESIEASTTSVNQNLKQLESEGLVFSTPDPEIGIISNRGQNARVWRLTVEGMAYNI